MRECDIKVRVRIEYDQETTGVFQLFRLAASIKQLMLAATIDSFRWFSLSLQGEIVKGQDELEENILSLQRSFINYLIVSGKLDLDTPHLTRRFDYYPRVPGSTFFHEYPSTEEKFAQWVEYEFPNLDGKLVQLQTGSIDFAFYAGMFLHVIYPNLDYNFCQDWCGSVSYKLQELFNRPQQVQPMRKFPHIPKAIAEAMKDQTITSMTIELDDFSVDIKRGPNL